MKLEREHRKEKRNSADESEAVRKEGINENS